jgi:hypothetical protein
MNCDVIKRRFRAVAAISLAVAVAVVHDALADSHVLRPDLTFLIACKARDRATLEWQIDEFLRQQGFKVLNQGRIQREHGYFLTGLKIIGLDDKRRVITVIHVPPAGGTYSVGLNTPPPTKRDPQLEDALLGFASNTLGCNVRQIDRGENATDAAGLHNEKIRRIERLFRQAEQLQGEWRL